MSESDPVLYGLKDHELLHHDIESLLEYHFDSEDRESIPLTTTVYHFRRMKPKVCVDRFLNMIYESLDEELGDPEADYTATFPNDVRVAAEHLAKLIEGSYKAWQCEPTGTSEEVNILEWYDKENNNE